MHWRAERVRLPTTLCDLVGLSYRPLTATVHERLCCCRSMAALNMTAYCAFKDLRKGTAQTITAVLAILDIGLCDENRNSLLLQSYKQNSTTNIIKTVTMLLSLYILEPIKLFLATDWEFSREGDVSVCSTISYTTLSPCWC